MLKTASHSSSTAAYLVVFFILANALFLISIRFLPFIDLPNHLAEATIYKYYQHADNALATCYQPVPWYYPNTFHAVFCSLFASVEFGNKVFHILCILLLQGSMFLVIRQLSGNAWYGLLSILFTYNYNMTFGFVGFAISIPVIVLLFYVTLRDIEEDKLVWKVVTSMLLILLFLMHAQNALFGLLLWGLMMLYAHGIKSKKLWLTGLTVPVPLLMLIFAWWTSREAAAQEGSTLQYLANYYSSTYFSELADRIRIVAFDNFQLQEGWIGILIATVFFLALIVPLIWFKVWRNPMYRSQLIYPIIFFVASAGCYLFLPNELPGQSPLSQRFCTLSLLSFIILGSILLKNVSSPGLKYFAIAITLCYSVLWFEYIYTFNRINQPFTKELFSGIHTDARMAGLVYDNKFRGRRVYIHFPNYFLVWNKGIVASKIIDYRFGIIKRLAPESSVPFYEEYIGDRYQKMTSYASLTYILAHGQAPVQPDVNLKDFELLRSTQSWHLFKRKDLLQ